jgi:4-aminobutyrate aminotransferase / (S)-3-amino-2-methylpropionate transaminase / 5-aminovalerate transaminase
MNRPESHSNADLQARRAAAVARGVASATAVFAYSAEGAQILDVEGHRYIDFASGIGVVATGHRHPAVMRAVQEQMTRFTHSAFQVMAYEPYVALAEALNVLAPLGEPAKSVFFTTGAEAVENAVKIARVATGRPAIITFSGAFHGRTMLTATLTGKMLPYKHAAGPAAPEIYRVPFPVAHEAVHPEDTLRALHGLFHADVEPARVAAIIIEPVQGEGGFHVASPELLRALRAQCDEHGILLIVDEIQSGFGRTGKLFAVEHAGVAPDLITVAKSLAGGFPLSGVIGKARIMDAVEPGGLGGTFGGSPLGCAAALAVLSVIREERLLERATEIGQRVRTVLEPLQVQGSVPICNLRGLGAMLAFDVVQARGSQTPDGPAARRLVARALQRGLLLLTCGGHGETVRLLMPLTIADAQLSVGLEILADEIRGMDR